VDGSSHWIPIEKEGFQKYARSRELRFARIPFSDYGGDEEVASLRKVLKRKNCTNPQLRGKCFAAWAEDHVTVVGVNETQALNGARSMETYIRRILRKKFDKVKKESKESATSVTSSISSDDVLSRENSMASSGDPTSSAGSQKEEKDEKEASSYPWSPVATWLPYWVAVAMNDDRFIVACGMWLGLPSSEFTRVVLVSGQIIARPKTKLK